MDVLLVEDDDSIAVPLAEGLRREGFEVVRAATGAEALAAEEPDIVLLDLRLPDMDGLEVCRQLRARSTVPIIVVSARGEEVDRVVGLELGADDYLVKPFSRLALLAHVKAVLRRAELPPPMSALPDFEAGDLAIRFQSQQVTVRGTLVKLTPFEYKLLYHLVRNAGRLMPHRALMERIWGTEYEPTEHQLRVLVNRVRAKIESPGNPPLIQTERGAGYRFVRPLRQSVGDSSAVTRS